uniref:Uncharacterized protein n=1 Tax=Anguilla anguilla TaxID=7936 RepID=A0A0E9P8G8_ANGAN
MDMYSKEMFTLPFCDLSYFKFFNSLTGAGKIKKSEYNPAGP